MAAGPAVGFTTRFSFDPAAPGSPVHRANGGKLAGSIFLQILRAWKDEREAPITHEVDNLDGRFDTRHKIQPALLSAAKDAQLTPQRVGIAYCQMLGRVLQEQNWPGHILAGLVTQGAMDVPDVVPIGIVDVRYQPASAPISSSSSKFTPGRQPVLVAGNRSLRITSSSSDIPNLQLRPLLQARAERQKTWLQALSLLLFDVVRHSYTIHVRTPELPQGEDRTTPYWMPGSEWEVIM